jgi:NTP pyrophosphatase (non-canonical NTP hydrolase)
VSGLSFDELHSAHDLWGLLVVNGLSFNELREANVARCQRWHPGFPIDDTWTGADWSNAMCGEVGEAANVVKKIRRVETGSAPGPDDPPVGTLVKMLADELGDIIAYADLLAAYYGIDLSQAVAQKFNRVSERQGFPERLP